MNQWVDDHWRWVEGRRRQGDAPGEWIGHSRFHYVPSPELLDSLSDEQRAIIQPIPPRFAPGQG